ATWPTRGGPTSSLFPSWGSRQDSMTLAATRDDFGGSWFLDAPRSGARARVSLRAAERADHQSSRRGPAQNENAVSANPARMSTTQWCRKYTVPRTSPAAKGIWTQANHRRYRQARSTARSATAQWSEGKAP